MTYHVRKREGKIFEFDLSKIVNAIKLAFDAQERNYNQDIIDYLNQRDDISYQEMKAILEELDFEVDDEGYIKW